MSRKILILSCLFCLCDDRNFALCQYELPQVKLEAFRPSGLRATIPDDPKIMQFAFHAKINSRITNVEPGDFYEDVKQKQNGQWMYWNPEVALEINDTVYYWIFIQHDRLGYRQDVAEWKVKELLPRGGCQNSITLIDGKKVCTGELIFEDVFDGNTINEDKWLIDQYIPTQGPDFEFVSYQKSNDVLYVKNGTLHIKPKIAPNVRGVLDLTQGCTSKRQKECRFESRFWQILPPVTSGNLRSKLSFQYGAIEIKAKLPAGDWIYPQLQLKSGDVEGYKILVAYARGNEKLLGSTGDDLGSRLLFAGPVENSTEPAKSTFLKSTKSDTPYTSGIHVFKLTWLPNKMTFFVDGVQFGSLDAAFNKPLTVDLGVGVGGINDFPEGYVSEGNREKPWRNTDSKQWKQFYDSRSHWSPSWKGEDAALKVDYVKVWAV